MKAYSTQQTEILANLTIAAVDFQYGRTRISQLVKEALEAGIRRDDVEKAVEASGCTHSTAVTYVAKAMKDAGLYDAKSRDTSKVDKQSPEAKDEMAKLYARFNGDKRAARNFVQKVMRAMDKELKAEKAQAPIKLPANNISGAIAANSGVAVAA